MSGLPYLPGRTPAFAFIVHPRGRDDMFRAKCLAFLRHISADDEDYVARVCALPPTVVGEVLFGFGPLRGEIVSIPCLPPEVASARGRREIARAVRIAIDRGATVIGLGALTAPATAGGAWIAEQLPAGITVTNGNAYTAAVLRRNVQAAIAGRAGGAAARVAVVGCTGSVGSLLCRLLATDGLDLVLIGRRVAKVRQVLGDLAGARISDDLAAASAADVIVVLTSAPEARITPSHVRAGAVVIDAAEPASIEDADALAWRGHMTVCRGGRVRIPGYCCTYDFGLDDPRDTFACLAETYLCAREGIRQHSVGTPERAFAELLERAATRQGVVPAFPHPVEEMVASGLLAEETVAAATHADGRVR